VATQNLTNYGTPLNSSGIPLDINTPLSFKQWKNVYFGVASNQEYELYNKYLTNWLTQKKEKAADFNTQLRLDYLGLLRHLQLFFSIEEKEIWYNQIDINNEKELLLAIPYFAKKLKEIGLYYLKLREEIKKSKVKYNLAGTNTGLVQQLQEQLLTSFTKKPNSFTTIPAAIWSHIPELSSIKDDLVIEVEELYDDHEYLDQSPNLPTSTYYNLSSDELKNFLQTKNIPLSAAEWMYKTGAYDRDLLQLLTELRDTQIEELPNSILVADRILSKYLGESKYFAGTPGLSVDTAFFNIFLQEGNNFFYWPSGPYPQDPESVPRYIPVPITSTGLEVSGTAGTDTTDSDVIFVKTARGIEGAWLKFQQYNESTNNVSTYIEGNAKTIFRYPYPGYGLSADDINWSGPSINYTPEYNYLDSKIKKAVQQEYWNFTTYLSTTTPIKLSDTTLIDQGSYANEKYELADTIKMWEYVPKLSSSAYSGEILEAWLYKMTKTDIPIAADFSNTVLWPYTRLDPTAPFPDFLPDNLQNICQPTQLSGVYLPHATSSNKLSTADIIFKINNYQDTYEQGIECAWLSGSYNQYEHKTFKTQQPGFNILMYSGEFTDFVWDGEDNIELQDVFKTYNHQPDCLFVNTLTATSDDFGLCTCGQTRFTPFGHPGTFFTDNNQFADFIVENTQYPKKFDLRTWKDRTGTTFASSSAFAWYKTNRKVGWGDGNWQTGNGGTPNKFNFQRGKKYTYYRANSRKLNSVNNPYPFLVVRHPYNNNNTIWIKAVKDENGSWESTDTPSDLILNGGDIFLYNKSPFVTYTTVFETTAPAFTATNLGSLWSTYDYISIDSDDFNIEPRVTVAYPATFALKLSSVVNIPRYVTVRGRRRIQQSPLALISNVIAISSWYLTTPPVTGNDREVYNFNNTFTFSFVPTLTGVYDIKAVAITSANVNDVKLQNAIKALRDNVLAASVLLTGYYYINNIPSITAVQLTTVLSALSTTLAPTPGFVINQPLFGWNYTTGRPAANTLGARPYWAVGFNDKSAPTAYKKVLSWGTPIRIVDGYNILTQPIISNISIFTNSYFEYTRKYPAAFIWNQPTDFRYEVNNKIWNKLYFESSAGSNLESIMFNIKNELITSATNIPSDLTITNIVDNEPVEVYYYANNSFVWNVSAYPETYELIISSLTSVQAVQPVQPWNNLTNRYYPTIASLPTLENLYSTTDAGGYFIPDNLGASTYLNKDFTATLSLTTNALTGFFEDGINYASGRGLSKIDQDSPYTIITDNNLWLKEPLVTGIAAGTIKKSVSKKYQKFIPYQSEYESNTRKQTGLILPTSRQTPWGGRNDSEWTDIANKPMTFTGVPSVSAWSNTQILKQNSKQQDNWVTDIYGNQYGLYKFLDNILPYDRRFVAGEIWTRKNSQFVSPAYISLSGVFDTYKNTTLKNELTGQGIRKIDMFFDTLYIETSGAVLLEKIVYDYNTDEIYSVTDDTRFLSLAMPVSLSLNRELTNSNLSSYTFAKVGDTWFMPQEKEVYISVCGLSGAMLTPSLYKLNLGSRTFINIFPNNSDTLLLNELSSLQLQSIDPPVLTYNSLIKKFTFTILGQNTSKKDHIIELTINNLANLTLDNIVVYKPETTTFAKLPPVITHSLTIPATASKTRTFQLSAQNNPTLYELPASILTYNDPLTINYKITDTGLFTITPLITGTFNLPFSVSNNVGPTFYTLTVNVSTY